MIEIERDLGLVLFSITLNFKSSWLEEVVESNWCPGNTHLALLYLELMVITEMKANGTVKKRK